MVSAPCSEDYGTCSPYGMGSQLKDGLRGAHETLDTVKDLGVWGTKIDKHGSDSTNTSTEEDVPRRDLLTI